MDRTCAYWKKPIEPAGNVISLCNNPDELNIGFTKQKIKTIYLSLPCRNSLPLFSLCVRTNVSYAVVGVFVTQTETKEDIAEALKVFQKWNSDWNPSHFIVDFCEAEISALEEVLKGMFESV